MADDVIQTVDVLLQKLRDMVRHMFDQPLREEYPKPRDYPLPVYNYRVTIGDGSESRTMGFAEVSGIAVENETVTYRHGLSFREGERIQAFRWDSFLPITLKRGVVPAADPLYLYDWMNEKKSRSVEVQLCDENGAAVLSWKIEVAVPVKLEAPGFDAASSDVAIESLELMARGVSLRRVS